MAFKSKAKAKSKSKQSRNQKTKAPPQLPTGYKVIERAPNWDMDKHPVIEGMRGKERRVTMYEGTKDERTVRVFTLTDETLGDVTVWKSGMLSDLFDSTEAGDFVRIEYLGLGKATKKGQNAPKLFHVGVKE